LPFLDIDTVSAVVAFYGSLELAKRVSTQHVSEKTIPAGHVAILGNAWRAASRCALVAMKRLGKYNPPLTHENDVTQLTGLTTELADILSNKWPRIERDDVTGRLRMGRASVRRKWRSRALRYYRQQEIRDLTHRTGARGVQMIKCQTSALATRFGQDVRVPIVDSPGLPLVLQWMGVRDYKRGAWNQPTAAAGLNLRRGKFIL
jgi:hypothetical protein